MRTSSLLVALAVIARPAPAQERTWPREIRAGTLSIVIYQPQVDSLTGNRLYGRAASSVTPSRSPTSFHDFSSR